MGRANDATGLRAALLLSLAAHVLLTFLALRRHASTTTDVPIAKDVPDVWAGTTLDIAVGETAAAPATPSEAAPAHEEVVATPEAKPDRAVEAAPVAPKPRSTSKADPDAPLPVSKPKESHAEAHSTPAKVSRSATAGATASSASAASADSPTGTFGSDAVPAPRQFGRALTRAIAPANQADDSWAKRPTGNAGSLVFDVTLDDEGHVTGFAPVDRDPPEHLTAMVRRATALLRGGVFGVHGEALGGTERLRLTVTVSDITTEDVAGGHAALAWSFESGRGQSSFTQANGRHVEIRIEVVPTAGAKKRLVGQRRRLTPAIWLEFHTPTLHRGVPCPPPRTSSRCRDHAA